MTIRKFILILTDSIKELFDIITGIVSDGVDRDLQIRHITIERL